MQLTITSIASLLALAATAVNATPTPEADLAERAGSWNIRFSNTGSTECPAVSSYSGSGSRACTVAPASARFVAATATGSCFLYATNDVTCSSGGYTAYENTPINCLVGDWKAFYVEC